MKRIKRMIALSLCVLLFGSCLVGCGEKGKKNNKGGSATEIEIAIWNSGLGVEWLENIKKGFEKKYPEYTVRYTATGSAVATLSAYGLHLTYLKPLKAQLI